MSNKVSIIKPDESDVILLENDVPDCPFRKNLTFVRTFPYTDPLTVNFSLTSFSVGEFTLSGEESFDGENGTVIIPASSSFKTVYVCSEAEQEFSVRLVKNPNYSYLINSGQNNLTLSQQNSLNPSYSWLESFGDYYSTGTARLNKIGSGALSNLNSDFVDKNEKHSSPVSVKLNDSESVVVFFTEAGITMNKYSLPGLSLLASETIIPGINNLLPFINSGVLPGGKFILFYHSCPTPEGFYGNSLPSGLTLEDAKTNYPFCYDEELVFPNSFSDSITLYGNNYSTYYQVYNSDLEPESDLVQVGGEDPPTCDQPPYDCDTDVDTSCITDYIDTWSFCEFSEFPLLDTSSGIIFDTTWFGCVNLLSFPEINTSKGKVFYLTWGNCFGLTEFPLLDFSSGVSFESSWYNCNNLISFPEADFSSALVLNSTWFLCSDLESFPLIDTSKCKIFKYTWSDCSGLESFPLLNVSSGVTFEGAWQGCSGLLSFPLLNVGMGENFAISWNGCSNLESFPPLNLSSGEDFYRAWGDCENLTTFPANMFNDCLATDFSEAWENCALDQQSVDNILVSIDTAGQSNGELDISGGTSSSPSATGITSKNNLIAKGWTVTTN